MIRLFRVLLVAFGSLVLLAACSGGGDETGSGDGGDSANREVAEAEPAEVENPDGLGDWLDGAGFQEAGAQAMGEVESVRFSLERTGAPVFIDGAQSIALDNLEGRFTVPGSADAVLGVTVAGALRTELGAIAIDDEIWLSNPTTGRFETLPPGFDIDPSLFFDPVDGWRPLLAGMTDVVVVGEETRAGETVFHITGTAPADRMQVITAGLVSGQDVDLDMWMIPATAEVAAVEFSTDFGGSISDWVLELTEYGETFDISPPE